MPVTVRLSRQVYEKLGDEVVNELVELLNAVDTASKDQLRELNETNWQRLEAKFTTFEARMEAKFDQLRTEMHDFKAELIKWMFIFWMGTVVSLGGLMFMLQAR